MNTRCASLTSLALASACVLATSVADADDRKSAAFEIIDRNAATMAQISDSIYSYAELGMQEVKSTKLLKETLEAAGFQVEMAAPACRPISGRSGAAASR